MKCPKCREGEVVKKKSKWKEFYGCSRYPDCDWKSWKNPVVVASGNGEDSGKDGDKESVGSIA